MDIQLIDVGARNGIHPRWQPFHKELDVIAFEPDIDERARLAAQEWPYKIQFLPVALGAQNNQNAKLYITRAPGCSSTLKPNMNLCEQFPFGASMEVVKTIPVTLQRMDSVVTVQPDVMKIDTQGTELHVLQGAGSLLDKTIAVEIEVEFIEQYIDQPLFADVDSFMRAQGFTLRGLRRTYWRTKATHLHACGGQIIHGDALYLRLNRISTPTGLKILSAYKQYDLLAAYGATNLIPCPPRWRGVLGRKLGSNRELRRFVDSLRPTQSGDWHDPEFF